jgi:hypothetical protein
VTESATSRKPASVGWPILVVAGLFGLLYVYDAWEAVSTMLTLPRYYDAYGLDPSEIPWWLLVTNLLLPIVVFALALLIGRRRSLASRALLLGVGLAVVAALSLGIIALQRALLG